MQENEFEKQVKRLMDDFSVAPSGQAWEKINRRLDEGRRRRLPFIFLLIAALATIGFFIFYSGNNKLPQQASIVKSDGSKISVPNAGNLSNDSVSSHDKAVAPASTGNNSEITNHSDIVANNTGKKYSLLSYQRSQVLQKGKKINSSEDNYDKKTEKLLAETSIFNNADTTQNNTAGAAVATGAIANPLLDNAHSIAENAIADKTDSSSNKKIETANNNVAAAHQKLKAGKKVSRWQFGVNAFYGRNDAVESLAETKAYAAQDASFASPSNIITGDTVFNKYPYTTGNAYSVGVDVQRRIAKKIVIGSGLTFTHLTTKSDVRQKVDANYNVGPTYLLVNSYYRPGVSASHANSYNFIELPLFIQQNFLQQNKFSFGYNAGFSVRRLISSNALIYNANSNVYFSRNELLRKMQWQAQAGLNFGFNTGKTTSVYIGPQVSYCLSNFMKNNDNGNYHFISYGVKAGLLLHKK